MKSNIRLVQPDEEKTYVCPMCNEARVANDSELCFQCKVSYGALPVSVDPTERARINAKKKDERNITKSFEVTLSRQYRVEGNGLMTDRDAINIARENFDAEKEELNAEEMCSVEVREFIDGPLSAREQLSPVSKRVG